MIADTKISKSLTIFLKNFLNFFALYKIDDTIPITQYYTYP